MATSKIKVTPAQIIALRSATQRENGSYELTTAKGQTLAALIRSGVVVDETRFLTIQGVSVMHSVAHVDVIASKGYLTTVSNDAESLELFTLPPVVESEGNVTVQGEYVEPTTMIVDGEEIPYDAFLSMAIQERARIDADGGCIGLCGLGTGCAHCDETYGALEPVEDAESVVDSTDEPFVVIPGTHALDLGTGAYNRFVGIGESAGVPGSLFTFGLATVISAHPGMGGTGHTNLPCEYGDVITVRTSLGDAQYSVQRKTHGDPVLLPYALDDVRCYVCEVHGDNAMQGQNIDGEWVCGYCVANERTPGMLNSHSLTFYVETENCGIKFECGNCKSIDSRGNFAAFMCRPTFTCYGENGAAVHMAPCAEALSIDGACCAIESDGTDLNADAGFVETMVTKEYELSVIVDDSTGASVSLGWVVLEMNSAQCMDFDRVAEAYGAAHGTGTPRHGWASIITVHDVCDA